MIEIKYVCSNGEEYNLIGDKMKPTSGYFHSYEWNPNTTERKMGVTVNSFTKDPAVGFTIIGISIICIGLFLLLLKPMFWICKKLIKLTGLFLRKIKSLFMRKKEG